MVPRAGDNAGKKKQLSNSNFRLLTGNYSSDFDLIVSVELGAQPHCRADRADLAPKSVRATAAVTAADA